MKKVCCLPILILVVFSIVFVSSDVWSRCTCVCMNGENQPLCTSTMDLKPICPPKICPIETPSIQPIAPITLPPLGTEECRMEQVYNQNTAQYQWMQVCR